MLELDETNIFLLTLLGDIHSLIKLLLCADRQHTLAVFYYRIYVKKNLALHDARKWRNYLAFRNFSLLANDVTKRGF